MKSQQEKDAAIKKLQELKKTMPAFSFFGDDNHRAIDWQIKVIEEDLSDDDVYDAMLDHYVESCAVTAAQWLSGEASDEELFGEE